MAKAYILINLGSPAEFSTGECERFLYEFLSDSFVLGLPTPFRQLLAKLIAKNRALPYMQALRAMCGDAKNHPIKKYTRSLANQIEKLSGVRTYAAFRYGEDSIFDIFAAAKRDGADEICALPLYPQNAHSTTQTARTSSIIAAAKLGLKLNFRQSYCENPQYIALLAKNLSACAEDCDNVLVSFHSVPISHLKKTAYLQECKMTMELLKNSMPQNKKFHLSWQSKMGRGEWLSPSSKDVATALARTGAKNIAAICAGFPCDCTETVVEIGKDLRDDFIAAGGESFRLAESPNDSPEHAEILKNILEEIK